MVAFQNWHPGKLILFWIICAIACVLLWLVIFEIGENMDADTPLFVPVILFALLAVDLVVAVTPFVVTWKWFSARER